MTCAQLNLANVAEDLVGLEGRKLVSSSSKSNVLNVAEDLVGLEGRKLSEIHSCRTSTHIRRGGPSWIRGSETQ